MRGFADLLNVDSLDRRGVDGESLAHCLAHVDGLCDVVTTLLDDIIPLDSDLLDLSVDCLSDYVHESLISDSSIGVGRANFVLNGDQRFVTNFDLCEKRLPIHGLMQTEKINTKNVEGYSNAGIR